MPADFLREESGNLTAEYVIQLKTATRLSILVLDNR